MVRDQIRSRLSIYVLRDLKKEAKRQKINISQITEEWLEVHTLIRKNDGDLHYAYFQLIKPIVPILGKYDCRIKIAEGKEMLPNFDDKGNEYKIPSPLNIFLMPDGSFYIDEHDRYFEDINMIAPGDFLNPGQILKNLLDALTKEKKAMRKKMRELLMARNIVYAISQSLLETPPTDNNEKSVSNQKMPTGKKSKTYRRKRYRKKISAEEPVRKPEK